MKKIIIATANHHKLEEYSAIFTPLGYQVFLPADLGLKLEFTETGTSFKENALIKAKSVHKEGYAVLADDSGLEIAALDNRPGLYSHRFYAELSQTEKNAKVLELLQGKEDRFARFIAVIALILPNQAPRFFTGIAPGYIMKEPIGDHGFGYDPIFFSFEANAPFATLSMGEKNRYSHRGKATKLLLEFLEKNMHKSNF
ncbi:MAG: RdgB/HAM1 family non-canonical purine NTP pyrophosphatase [Bacilli bacterium]|jgi:XTP/dITP diphosphohydrolase